MSKPILYLSFDIESDGTNPLINNMLSIGIYGLDKDENEIMSFYANLEELCGHIPDEQCMQDFWSKQPKAWSELQVDKKPTHVAFKQLSDELIVLSKDYKIEFVAMPACFDWMFLKSYYEFAKNTDKSITYNIGFQCTCMSTTFNIYRKFNKLSSKEYTKFKDSLIAEDASQLHNALYDAKLQGLRYVKLLKLMDKASYKSYDIERICSGMH